MSPDTSRDADVLVFGGGLAGLTAALSAAETGARVALLEKGDELGGSFVLSGGLVWTWRDPDTMRAEVPLADHRLTDLLIEHLDEDFEWLEQWGVKPVSRFPAHLIGIGVDPAPTVATLARLLEESGGRIELATGLAGLRAEPDGVTVTVADRRRGVCEERTCGAVVLATGGFQGSAELVARYLCVPPSSLQLRANRWSTGDALRAVLECGGALSGGMDDFYGHSFPDTPETEVSPAWYRGISQYWGNKGVALNVRGERFADESEGTTLENRLNFALAHQPGGIGFYVIDHETARSSEMPDGSNAATAIQRARDAGAPVIEADTVDELCRRLDAEQGVPYERSLATLEQYQQAMRGEAKSALYPPRLGNRAPLEHPPFRAVRVRAAVTFTGGGIAVDRQLRVRAQAGAAASVRPPGLLTTDESDDGVVLPGIYAAGTDVGNVSHGGYVGGLAAAVVFGRIAGRNAALRAIKET